MKTYYTYEEFHFACKDENNAGKENKIRIISINGKTAVYESKGKTYSAEIATLVNGACHEFGVVENPEFLKDWNGFRNASIH